MNNDRDVRLSKILSEARELIAMFPVRTDDWSGRVNDLLARYRAELKDANEPKP